jgi:hypothetical protein
VQRIGFLLVYLGFAYGVVCVWWGWRASRRADALDRSTRALLWTGALCALVAPASFWLVWIEGHRPDGQFVEVIGWAALDPYSTGLTVLLAATIARLTVRGGGLGGLPMASACAALAALVGGNALIQHATTRGSVPRVGAGVAAAAAVGLLLVAVAIAWPALRRER